MLAALLTSACTCMHCKLLQLFLPVRLFQIAEMTNGSVSQTCKIFLLGIMLLLLVPQSRTDTCLPSVVFLDSCWHQKVTSINGLSRLKKSIWNARNHSKISSNHSAPSLVMCLLLCRSPQRHPESRSPRNGHATVLTVTSTSLPTRCKSHYEENTNEEG